MPESKITPELKKTIPWKLALIFLLFSAAIILLGIYYYKSQRARIFTEQENNLSAIAFLKIKQIVSWHKERLGDAKVIKNDEPLIRSISHFFGNKNKEIKSELDDWMKSIINEYDYRNVLIADTSLKVRLSVVPSDSILGDSIKKEMKITLKVENVIMTDLHQSKEVPYIHLDILIPLFNSVNKKRVAVGVAILRIDPAKVLFPLIQSWPTQSKSSETLLLRKEGDSILYLNELRHQKNTALNLKLPVSKENLLASKAIKGIEGIVEGVDYRNVPVVGYAAGIPGLPWFMIAKVDKEEILSPLKRYVFLILIVTVLLILINASIFGFWIWTQQINLYRQQVANDVKLVQADNDLRKSEKLFRELFENMLNGFAYCKMLYEEGLPPDFLYVNVNDAFESLTGLKDVKGRKVSEVIPGIQEADPELLERYSKVALTGKPEVFETYVESLKMWFAISLYSPQKEYFVAVFDVITERKQAEEALRESEDKFKYIFDHSVIGKSITLPSGEIHVNKTFCDMLGYSQEELEKTKWQDISHPDDIETTEEMIRSLISGEKDSARFVKRYLRKDGSVVWTDVGTALRRDSFGRPLYFMTAINDITEREHAEEALRDSEERFSKSFRTSPISFMIANLEDGEIIEVNDAFTNISGFTREEALASTTLNLKIWVREEDRKHMITSLRDGNAILGLETMLRGKNGNVITVLLSAQLIQLGNRNCVISSIEDITKRKEAEAELHIQSEIMSHMAEAVYLVRMEDGIIVYTNSRFEELFGYGPGEMTGRPVSIVNAPTEKSPEETAKEIMSELDKKGLWKGEVLNIKKDETVFWSNANVTIFDHSKFGKVLVSVQEDITGRKNAESQIKKLNEELEVRVIQRTEQLEAANKELEAFSYSVSHDLRAPLRSVHGYTKILVEEYENSLDDEGKRICKIISSSATQMGELIDDLLSFSRIGRSSLNPSLLDMKAIVSSAFDDISSNKEQSRTNLKIGRLHKAFGDASLLKLVWNNLISNAIKYSSKENISEISISSHLKYDRITYSIKDNGVGFDMNYKHKLFGVFQRLHSEAEFEGNGVGLAIVRRIVLKHGGNVWAESEVGKGATFYFSLPVEGDWQLATGNEQAKNPKRNT